MQNVVVRLTKQASKEATQGHQQVSVSKKLSRKDTHQGATATKGNEHRTKLAPARQKLDGIFGKQNTKHQEYQTLASITKHKAEQKRKEKCNPMGRIHRAVLRNTIAQNHAIKALDEFSVVQLNGNLTLTFFNLWNFFWIIGGDCNGTLGQLLQLLGKRGHVFCSNPTRNLVCCLGVI